MSSQPQAASNSMKAASAQHQQPPWKVDESKSHSNIRPAYNGSTTTTTPTAASTQFASVRGRSNGGLGGRGGVYGSGAKAKILAGGYVARRSHSTSEEPLLVKLYEEPQRRRGALASRSEADILNSLQQRQQQQPLPRMICHDHKANSDWMLHQSGNRKDSEPIYSIPDLSAAGSRPTSKRQNAHYYSSTPDALDSYCLGQVSKSSPQRRPPPPLPKAKPPQKATKAPQTASEDNGLPPLSSPTSLSFTIRMRPPAKAKENLLTVNERINDLQSNLTDLSKLTRQSRELAHSTENVFHGDPMESITSSSGLSTLNMGHFRKTRDFGDFQILTDSPEKTKTRPKPPPKPKMVDV